MKPLPGDPNRVREDGKKMVGIADQIHEAANTLKKVGNYDGYKGDAVTALRENANDLADVLYKAGIRYREGGNALQWYAEELHHAQARVQKAIARSSGTDVTGSAARAAAADLEVLKPTLDIHEKAEALARAKTAHIDAAHQAKEAAAARLEYEDARHDLDVAGHEAAKRVHAANENSIQDTFADHYKNFLAQNRGWLSPVLEALKEALDKTAQIVLIAAGVVALSAFIFGPEMLAVAGFLLAINKVLSVASLAVTLGQGLIGDATFGDLAVALIMVGVGTFLGKLGKFKGAEPLPQAKGEIVGANYGVRLKWIKDAVPMSKPLWDIAEVADKWDITKDQLVSPIGEWASVAGGPVTEGLWDTSITDVLPADNAANVGEYSQINIDQIVSQSFGQPVADAPQTATPCRVGE